MTLRRLALLLPALLLSACPGKPRSLVYDLVDRVAVSEVWSAADVLRFGTPAAEPRLGEGFFREAAGRGEPFAWAGREVEVLFQWTSLAPRVAILDGAPFAGVGEQSVQVHLNGTPVERFSMNPARHRYRIGLPAEAQRIGGNRLRLSFSGTAAPADTDAGSSDRRALAAALYTLVTGPASDASLEELLRRDAPRPFAVGEQGAVPTLTLVGPAVVRYALRLPAAAELRFTPELEPAAGAAAGAASMRVLLETESGERELWSRVVDGRARKAREQSVALPGRPGDVVRLGLAVGPAAKGGFAWARFVAPRVMGRGTGDPLQPIALSGDEQAKADPLRQALSKANVLLVILDAGRARQFGAYGYNRPTTPEIDRIAREGVVFERVYTPAVYTLGAMSSVWTSQYPDRHHSAISFSERLPKERLTLAELLSAQGIHTAGFVANAVAGSAFGFDRGFSEFHEVFRTLGSRGDVFRQALPPWFARNKDRRHFAYVHFREPHFPYNPIPPFDTRFGPEGPISAEARADKSFFRDVNQGRRPFSEEEREHLVRLYDGNLAFADQEVGALRRTLEAEGLWERTVVIIAADHGEELREHGWIDHNVHVFEESVHVPLIIRFPKGTSAAGKRVPALSDLLDVAPTIADVFGVLGKGGSDREFQGRSLLPVLMGAPGKEAVLSRTVWDRPRYALRDERFKYFFDSRSGEERLYDLASDPGETTDVSRRERLRTAYYREALHHWALRVARPAAGGPGPKTPGDTASPPTTMTCQQCQNLKALGYIDGDCSAYCK